MTAPAGVLVLHDPRMAHHDPGPGHPERPERLRAVVERLAATPLPGAAWRAPREAPREALARVHAAPHLDRLEILAGHTARLDPDTAMSPGSYEAALLAAGAAVDAVDALMAGEARRALALVRPPGHHAEAARAMGFCLLNNVAVAAEHAVRAHGLERVLVVDWDIHHGNGTQHAFEARRDVLFFSSHRWPFYPGTGRLEETGRGEGAGHTVNAPLPSGLNDADHAALYRELLAPLAAAFAPQLVLVSAGFDSHAADPLGDQQVTDEGFAALCGVVQEIADAHAGGRLALLLEGGYDLDGLARSVEACARVLDGAVPPEPHGTTARGDRVLSEVVGFHARAHAALRL